MMSHVSENLAVTFDTLNCVCQPFHAFSHSLCGVYGELGGQWHNDDDALSSM